MGPTEDSTISKMVIGVGVEGHSLEQVIAQLDKLINVISIKEIVSGKIEEVNDTQKMKVTSKIILKTKVVPGFEVLSAPNSDDIVVVDTVSMKIDDIATKLNDRKLSGNLDGSLKSKRGNRLRMKLFKREKDKKNKSKNNKKKKGVLNLLEINHVEEENEGHAEGDDAKEEKGRPELKEECNKMVCG